VKGTANVVKKGRAEKGGYVALDETHFYPQGGGQQSDDGYLTVNDVDIPVTFVGFKDGVVQHFIPDVYLSEIGEGDVVSYSINEEKRIRNAKLHSSGHLISHVLETMSPTMIPIKAYHFSDGAYIELVDENRVGSAEMLEDINNAITSVTSTNFDISARLSNYTEVSAIRPSLAPLIPKDKPTRIVTFGDYTPMPCGGTHVRQVSELVGLSVVRIKRKKANLKVSYEI